MPLFSYHNGTQFFWSIISSNVNVINVRLLLKITLYYKKWIWNSLTWNSYHPLLIWMTKRFWREMAEWHKLLRATRDSKLYSHDCQCTGETEQIEKKTVCKSGKWWTAWYLEIKVLCWTDLTCNGHVNHLPELTLQFQA